jgi:hypothetical protein
MTHRQDAAAEFLRTEQETAHHSSQITKRLAEELLAAAASTHWGQAFIQMRAQQMLTQRLRSEVNMTLTSLSRQPKYVAPLHDANPWTRIEEHLNRAADDLATSLVDTWRDEHFLFEAGKRDDPPDWPTVTEIK